MKSRSNRLQNSEQHDDWTNGSWTVDCTCGVNFDDGEEMVDCDECGVWVHTRCSRYVRGDKDFICDKCKNKYRNDSEETEVAQLLVELPTKTMKMQSSYATNIPPQRPLRRLWTEIPMEERVHVHGVPGGDPSLFAGLSTIFSPQLWKCTGHVPKKLNFQYKEFSCWDEPVDGNNIEDENENQDDRGAGVLFSLSKDGIISGSTPVEALVGMRGRDEEGRSNEKSISKEPKKTLCDDDVKSPCKDDVGDSRFCMKERTQVQPFLAQSSKKGEEDSTIARNSSKKKTGTLEKELDVRKRVEKASFTVFPPTSDAKRLDFHEDRDPKHFGMGTARVKTGKTKVSGPCEAPTNPAEDSNVVDKLKNNLATGKLCLDSVSSEVPRSSTGDELDKEKANDKDPTTVESSFKSVALIEGNRKMVDNLDDTREDFTHSYEKSPVEDLPRTISEAEDSRNIQHSSCGAVLSFSQTLVRVKPELNDKSGASDATQTRMSSDVKSEALKVNNADGSSSQWTDHKVRDVDQNSAIVDGCETNMGREPSGEPVQPKQHMEISEGSVVVHKSSLESQNCLGLANELPKSGRTMLNVSVLSTRQEVAPSGKPSSSSSVSILAKSTVSDAFRATDTQNSCPNTSDRVTSECNISIKKGHAGTDIVGNEMQDVSRKSSQDHKKSSGNSVVNISSSSRISHTYVSKRIMSGSKDSVHLSSTKASPSHNVAATSGSSDSAGSLHNQVEANVENKISSSCAIQRGEKNNLPNVQSSKQNYSTSAHPPVSSSAAALSDEELALLLHQELNSSTRVPRVPRVRNAGSLPQLSSSTATGTLLKRTSSCGGKDNNSASKRKNKDVVKDGLRSSRETEDEVKKTKRLMPPSPDQKIQDSMYVKDGPSKKEDDGSSTVSHAIKKKLPSVSTTANSGPSSSAEATDRTFSSVRKSPREDPDDRIGTVGPGYRTLPRLISDIMSKGKRMTYEELCSAVLPHWNNLRKHNGERYAYSSHSQAVLDCLRNRHEWARLVDRGPKTNSSRKRRMIDAEESDDDEYIKGRSTKETEGKSLESPREEFPKGKRKARQRRRLVLKGRGIREVRKRRKAVMSSDEDDDGDGGPFSDSSEESMFSMQDSQGGDSHPAEASASSDEAGNL